MARPVWDDAYVNRKTRQREIISCHWPQPDRKSSILEVWAAPATPKTIPEGGGLRPPPSGMVFGAAGSAQIPKIDDLRPALKPCIKNPSVPWSYDEPPLASTRRPEFRGSSKIFSLAKLPAPLGFSTDRGFWTNFEIQATECLATKARHMTRP